MATNTVLDASDRTKQSSLIQEMVRRLLHTISMLGHSVRMKKLEILAQKMRNSNHSMEFTKKIMISGIPSYTAKWRNNKYPEDHPLYRPLHLSTSYQSWKKKQIARENWYFNHTM